MKKLLFILTGFFFNFSLFAQSTQTEDEVYIGKGKTFGNYKGTSIIIPDVNRDSKPVKGLNTITGVVVGLKSGTDGWCEEDCLTISVKRDDSTIVKVGTKENGFTVPQKIMGRRIIVESADPSELIRERKTTGKDYQKNIQVAATAIMVLD